MTKNKTLKQTRIAELNAQHDEPDQSGFDEEDLYRFLRGGLAAK